MLVTRWSHILTSLLLRRMVVAMLLLVTTAYAVKPAVSDDFTDRRLTIGAKIFRALLAADLGLEKKTTPDGELNLCLLYTDESSNAETVAKTLANRDDPRIRGKKLHIETLPYAQCLDDSAGRHTAIFLTQRLNDAELSRLLVSAGRHGILVFSPFEGDIERGVPGGIAVEARVRPYLNLTALRRADIRLKSFFVEVAKKYE